MEEIINKVANSSLITIDLEDFYPKGERILYDLKQNLWQGLILKEKDFREFLKNHDFSQYQDKYVAIFCSVDAIIPTWAYMLLTLQFNVYAKKVVFGTLEDLDKELLKEKLQTIDLEEFRDKKVVIKGCGKINIPTHTYVLLTNILQPYVQSLMYGEPCSTVPLFKKLRIKN
jgi:hypothetical protein